MRQKTIKSGFIIFLILSDRPTTRTRYKLQLCCGQSVGLSFLIIRVVGRRKLFSFPGAKVLLIGGSVVVVFTTFSTALQLSAGFARRKDRNDTLLPRMLPYKKNPLIQQAVGREL